MPTCNYTIPCTCTIGSVHVWVGPFVVTQIVLIWPTLKCELVWLLFKLQVVFLAVWEAPQGQLDAVVELMLFSSLDMFISESSLDDLFLDDFESDEVASAVATCGQAMRQLRKLSITYINPLPLLRALGDRDCPLEHVTVEEPPWVCTILVCIDRTDDVMC